MADKKFLMLSLDDEATKKIANVVSNDTCKKLLDVLSEKDLTESELAKKLDIPLSTAHYNLRQLVDVGLVSADEFHYSKKGKEMLHYKLANKYIIITPKAVTGIREKLRKILPVALISAGAAGIAQLISQYSSQNAPGYGPMIPYGADSEMFQSAAPVMKSMAAQAPLSPLPSETISSFPFDIAAWFFAGALFGMAVYMMLSAVRKEE